MSGINLINQYREANDYNQKYINKKILLNKLLYDPEIKGIIMNSPRLENQLDNLVIECLKRNEMSLDDSINDFIHQTLIGNTAYTEILNARDILSGNSALTPVERLEPSKTTLAETPVVVQASLVEEPVSETKAQPVKEQVSETKAQPVKEQVSETKAQPPGRSTFGDVLDVAGAIASAATKTAVTGMAIATGTPPPTLS
jgi:hypothetical protein